MEQLDRTARDIINPPDKVQRSCTRKATLEKMGKFVILPKPGKGNEKARQAFDDQRTALDNLRQDALQKCRERHEKYKVAKMEHDKLMASLGVSL